jgi:hypothetical protein
VALASGAPASTGSGRAIAIGAAASGPRAIAGVSVAPAGPSPPARTIAKAIAAATAIKPSTSGIHTPRRAGKTWCISSGWC